MAQTSSNTSVHAMIIVNDKIMNYYDYDTIDYTTSWLHSLIDFYSKNSAGALDIESFIVI